MKTHVFDVLAILLGTSFILLNKPLGELFRQWRIMVSSRDLGLWPFRIPLIIVGILFIMMSIVGW